MCNQKTTYLSPRQCNAKFGFPLNRLRGMIRRGEVQGFYSGNRFYIDETAFQKKLETATETNARF